MKLLNEETALLKKREFKTLDKLQARKRQLSLSFDKHQTAVRAHPEVLDNVPDDDRTELRNLYQRFRCALSDNILALRSSHDAAERVVSLIMESVRKQLWQAPDRLCSLCAARPADRGRQQKSLIRALTAPIMHGMRLAKGDALRKERTTGLWPL